MVFKYLRENFNKANLPLALELPFIFNLNGIKIGGRIDRIENNQNAIRNEIDRVSLINKENSGIQILQGDGALIMIFGIVTVIFICIYFNKTAENYKKTAEILAGEINDSNDEKLKLKVLKAAQHTSVAKHIYGLIKR